MARLLPYLGSVLLLLLRCHGQFYSPYDVLPTEPFGSNGGQFTFPAGETSTYAEGSPMTIRWGTNFSAVNLYMVFNASVEPPSAGLQRQLASGYSRTTFDWTVSCDPDCQAPYAVKAVDAFGDADAIYNEGFWSRQFWISPSVTSSSAAPSSTSTSSSSIGSVTSSAIAAPTSRPETSATPTGDSDSDSSSNTTAIGAGVGVGAGVVVVALILGVWWFLRRRKAKAAQNQGPPGGQNQPMPYGDHSSYGAPTSYDGHSGYQSPPLQSQAPYYSDSYYPPMSEAPGYKDAQEVPGSTPGRVEPQELPGKVN